MTNAGATLQKRARIGLPMDGKVILEQFQDNLGPLLDTYEQAIYLYVLSIEKDFWANWISGIALALCNDSRGREMKPIFSHRSG